MKNFRNYLNEIQIKEECLEFLQEKLQKDYSFSLVKDLLSLPCMKYEVRHKLAIVLALLEDGEVNDTIVDWLAEILDNITGELWRGYENRLNNFVENYYYRLNRSQMLLLANAVEIMYAKGFDTFGLLNLIYQRVPLSDVCFNPYSEDNTRIKLAKIAYSTTKYNMNDNLEEFKCLKRNLKAAGYNHLLRILNYYKGVCLGSIFHKIDYKGADYYILKAKNNQFELAYIYLNYRGNNSETSKKC